MVRAHERAQLSAVMVGSHEQVALVLVRVLAGRLGGSCQTLEVEFVRVPLAVHLGHDIFIVVVSAGGGQTRIALISYRTRDDSNLLSNSWSSIRLTIESVCH